MLCDQNERRNKDDKRRDQPRHPNAAAAGGEIRLIILGVRHLALGTRADGASVPPFLSLLHSSEIFHRR